MSIVLNINGERRVLARLQEAIEATGSPKEALDEVGDVLVREFTQNFPAEGKRLDSRWAPLAVATLKEKARLGFGGKPILVRTGLLMNSFKKYVQKFAVRVANPVKYGVYHQQGSAKLPRRPIMLLPLRIRREITAAFTKFIHNALTKRI